MAYTPTTFFKNGDEEIAYSWEDHYQFLWEGWTADGPAPPPDPDNITATLGDVQDATAVTEATLTGNYTAADNVVRAEFDGADDTVRAEFAAADAIVRSDFETADLLKVTKGDLVLDVRDYGAAGNGVTDDTAAITAAIAVGAANGAKVILGGVNKTYVASQIVLGFRGALEIPTGVTLRRLAGDAQTGPLVLLNRNHGSITGKGTIEALNACPSGVVRIERTDGTAEWSRLDNVQIKGPGKAVTGSTGVVLSGTSTFQNRLNGVVISDVDLGVRHEGGANMNHMTDVDFYNIGTTVCDFNGTLESSVIGGSVSSSTNVTVFKLRSNATYNRIVGFLAEPGGTATFYDVTAGCLENSFTACTANTTNIGTDLGTRTTQMLNSARSSTWQSKVSISVKDYGAVGDGVTDDTAAINNAITAANLANGIGGATAVHFPYTANGYAAASTITLKTGVILRGYQRVKIKATASHSFLIDTVSAADNCGLEGLTLDANGLITSALMRANAATNVRVIDCTFNDTLAALYGIDTAVGASDLRIERNTFYGCKHGIRLLGGPDRVWVQGNRIRNWTQRAIYVPSDATNAVDGLWVTENHISELGVGGTVRQPIAIEGNTANLNKNIHITGNTVVGPAAAWTAASNPGTADQISVQATQDFEVSRNISIDGGDMGITIGSDAIRGVVSGNVCRSNDVSGINLGVSSINSARNINVVGNVCMNNGQNRNGDRAALGRSGIRVAKGVDILISGNHCGDDQGTKTQQYGITPGNLTGGTIVSNRLVGNAIAEYYYDTGNSNLVISDYTTTHTTAELAAIGNAINTIGKYAGRFVFNATTSKPVWAVGTTAAAVWVDATGATAHTPV